MIVWQILFILFLIQLPDLCNGSHFRGGIVSWRALNTTPPSGSIAEILIHQRYSWRRSYPLWVTCNDASIASQTVIGTGTGYLHCFVGGSCPSFTQISADVVCTDYSIGTDFSSGERYDRRNLTIGQSYTVGFSGSAWFVLAIGGNGAWEATGRIDLTVRGDGKLNTSPVTSTLPIIYREVGIQHVHIIQMADADSTDTLRCRWSTDNTVGFTNTNGFDECGSVCAPSLPTGYTLISDNCTLVFTLTATTYYAVALQIEDFYTSTSPTPMSSVPIQFLFYGRPPVGGCSTAPTIIGVRPNLACIGTPIGLLTNETVIAQVGCPGKTIIDFTTSSPVGLIKSAIMNPSIGIYIITLLWVPVADQYGPQSFCAGAVDSTNVQSDPWCITFLVGFTAPNLQTPLFVQGSASPVGTVFSNQTIFSIQSVNGVGVNRPGRNGTWIYFNDATLNNTVLLQYDCGWSPNVIYSGDTIIIYAPYPWIPGHSYFVTFDSGASSGTDFCRAESAPITSPNFWVFNIWNPSLSSTTTTTTTPPTTHTVTTKAIGTTTPIANLTTTGVIVTPSLTFTTTTVTTISTTTANTTSSSNQMASTTEMNVISSEDFVIACEQPVAIGTAVVMSTMLVIHTVAMYAFFIKMDKTFNPHRIQANQRRSQFFKRLQGHK